MGEFMKKYYHGTQQHGPYFEGWYFKFQTKDGKSIALIPALHMDETNQKSASLQIISNKKTWWLEFPETAFHASQDVFEIRIGQTIFTEREVLLHIEQPGISLQGKLQFGIFTPLPSDIMGPFRFIPRMECSHSVISMAHTLDGTLTLNDEKMDFSGGMGYIEGDRGRSFPNAYLWTQCMWQDVQYHSIMLSIATIPIGKWNFHGCIGVIFHEGKQYRLATYRGARITQWSWNGAEICQGNYRLTVKVLQEQAHPLRAPVQGNMQRTIHESLCAKVRYRFWIKNRLVLEHIDDCASFEYTDSM